MSDQKPSCNTIEDAIELAARMENDSFRNYLSALRMVKDQGAREILREAALDELEHKHQLEKTLVEGEMKGDGRLQKKAAVMNLGSILGKREIGPDSDVQEALSFAIHLEKGAVDFYQQMAEGYSGAPIGVLFEHMLADESRHLQCLEDLYEAHFLVEN
ncbi:ferritin family protein [Geomonas sp. RF6]|uniref:ferritin family protein n=1 Tax=Geomonas sp. RF6 TaxID=2897342 RepID=UPI001E509753|nr:ferritin family protein [Geomonas sp. RF6]UFS71779.1 ferritin family protein [Geomonas sp. RF6]